MSERCFTPEFNQHSPGVVVGYSEVPMVDMRAQVAKITGHGSVNCRSLNTSNLSRRSPMSERDSICALAEKPLAVKGVEFPGYRVSSLGFVASQWQMRNNSATGRLEWTRGESWSVLLPYLVHGYPTVALRRNGRTVRVTVHRIVAEAFIGPCPDGMEVCHEDGDRQNSAVGNLRYDTRKNNLADRTRHGTDQRGERNPSAKLTDAEVEQIKLQRSQGVLLRIIAERFGIRESTVSRIVNGVRRA